MYAAFCEIACMHRFKDQSPSDVSKGADLITMTRFLYDASLLYLGMGEGSAAHTPL